MTENTQMFQSCKHVFRPLATAKRLLEGLQWNVSIVQARLSAFSHRTCILGQLYGDVSIVQARLSAFSPAMVFFLKGKLDCFNRASTSFGL